MWKKTIIFLCTICIAIGATAQDKEVRNLLRKGNKQYRDSLYTAAEVFYRKAQSKKPADATISYNLGTTIFMRGHQQHLKNGGKTSGVSPEDSLINQGFEELQRASKMEKDPQKLADIYRNMGVILQGKQQHKECIEAYKQSLRKDPTDDEVRYNLALAQKQLKDQEKNQNNDQQQENKQDQKQQQQEENKQQEDKQQNNNQDKNPPQNKMSKDAANQLLNSIMQEERKVQEKAKKGLRVRGKKLEKDW